MLLLQYFEQRQTEMGPEWEAYYEGLLDLTGVPQERRPWRPKRFEPATLMTRCLLRHVV